MSFLTLSSLSLTTITFRSIYFPPQPEFLYNPIKFGTTPSFYVYTYSFSPSKLPFLPVNYTDRPLSNNQKKWPPFIKNGGHMLIYNR